MKHENGYHVDVADLKIVPQDITYIVKRRIEGGGACELKSA
jgi:hypothetical protein